MKKFVSIALAIVMVLSVSVVAFADDDAYVNSIASEVLTDYDVLFPIDNGWWYEDDDLGSSTDDGAAFVEAIQTEGAKIVIKTDAEAGSEEEDVGGFQFGIQTTDTWVNVLIVSYTDGEGNLMFPDSTVVEGDYAYVVADAAEFIELCASADVDLTSNSWRWISGAASGCKTYDVYVILPASAESAEESSEEAESSETSETTESSESSESASSPDTGVALALVPMAIAGIAVVSSKRR